MGVSALASGTITAALESFPDGEVFLLDYDRTPGTYSVQTRNEKKVVSLLNMRFSKRFYLRNNIARLLAVTILSRFLPETWRIRWLKSYPVLKAILEADIVASLSGGDSFSDIYGLGRLLYVALPQVLVLQLQKPLVLLPQTLGPFKSRFARIIGTYILRGAECVYARDRISLEEVRPLMGSRSSQLRFTQDMAFVLEPVRPSDAKLVGLPLRESARPLVGLNVSGLLLMGGYTRNNMFASKVDYARVLQEVATFFIREHDADILLLPHVFSDDEESDFHACAKMHRELHRTHSGRVHFLSERFDQHEIKLHHRTLRLLRRFQDACLHRCALTMCSRGLFGI